MLLQENGQEINCLYLCSRLLSFLQSVQIVCTFSSCEFFERPGEITIAKEVIKESSVSWFADFVCVLGLFFEPAQHRTDGLLAPE